MHKSGYMYVAMYVATHAWVCIYTLNSAYNAVIFLMKNQL